MARIPRYLFFALVPFVFGCNGRPDDEIPVVVIPKGMTHEHWQSVRRGAERCAADLLAEEGVRVRVIFDGPLRERDAMEQIRIVDRRVATGARGIVLAPQHSHTMTATVKRAADAGVPVVVIDSGLAETEYYVKYVATDNYNGGRLAARHLLSELRKQGKTKPRLVLFRYALGSESTEQREKGFEDTVRAAVGRKEIEVEWLSTDKYAGATIDSARREAGPLVLQFRDKMDAVFAPNESSASGMIAELRSQGVLDNRQPGFPQVLVMAFDASPPLREAIQEGYAVGSVLQDPYKMGYQSTWYCVRAIRGEDVSKPKELWTGEHVVISRGRKLVTEANPDPEFVLGLYDPSAQARRTTSELRTPAKAAP